MIEIVECYAGYDYAGRPRAFYWEGMRWEVAEVVSQARTPAGKRFLIRTADGQVFELFYSTYRDEWQIHQP